MNRDLYWDRQRNTERLLRSAVSYLKPSECEIAGALCKCVISRTSSRNEP